MHGHIGPIMVNRVLPGQPTRLYSAANLFRFSGTW